MTKHNKHNIHITSHITASYNNSTIECLRYNLFHEPSNLLTGLTASWIREIPGSFFYYLSYRGTTRILQKITNTESQDPSLWMVLTGGGVAGITFWSMVYPVDLVKSKQQSKDIFEHIGTNTKSESNLWSLMTDRVKRYGIKSLYHGWSVAAVRAVIANALIFGGYEYSRKLLDTMIVDQFVEIEKMDDIDVAREIQ